MITHSHEQLKQMLTFQNTNIIAYVHQEKKRIAHNKHMEITIQQMPSPDYGNNFQNLKTTTKT